MSTSTNTKRSLKSAMKPSRRDDAPYNNDPPHSEPELLFDMELQSANEDDSALFNLMPPQFARPKSLLSRGLHALRIQIPCKALQNAPIPRFRRLPAPEPDTTRDLDEVSLYSSISDEGCLSVDSHSSGSSSSTGSHRRVRFLVPASQDSPFPHRADNEEPTWMDF